MANYRNLKAAISAAIKTNGNQEITGQVLQDVLNSIVSVIGANYTFAGVATPATNPGTPDQNVMYLAMEVGTYTNFNGTVLPAGISLLMWNGTWRSETVMCGDGGVFDISVYKSSGGTLATFADLTAALDGGNNIPASARKGGMSVKFVRSSDNKYVQCRLMANQFSTTPSDWQGIDAEPTYGSKNLVESGGVVNAIHEYVHTDNNPEFKKLELDSDNNIISGIDYKDVEHHYNKHQFDGGLSANEINLCGYDWQGVDSEPTTGSKNLVESGGVLNAIHEYAYTDNNPEFKYLELDSDNNIISGIDYKDVEHHYNKHQFDGGLIANEITLGEYDLEDVVVKTETLAEDALCKTIITDIKKSSSSVVPIMIFSNPTHKPKQLYIKVLSNKSSLSRVSVEYIKEDGTYEYAGHDIPTGVDVAINVDNSRSVNQIFYNSQNITHEGKISIRIYESNRDILWLGTSIPAGVVASVGSYPSLVGKSLGINVINKALGESYLRRNATPPTQFEHFVGRSLSETEAEKIAYLRPLYEGGQMTEEQYNSYIKFGYDYRILPYINGTKASCDTVVIDHGYNDRGSFDTILNNWDSQDFILHSNDSSFDRTNYVGAFCFLLKKIWEVNPNIKILVISHLENLTGSDIFPNDVQGRRGYKICTVQKKIAEHFDFPFIDICNNIGFSMNIIPSTVDFLTDFNARYGTSYSPVDYTGETNPSTCVTRFQMFCPDSVHPHSDLSGLSLKMIANVLINKLNKLL